MFEVFSGNSLIKVCKDAQSVCNAIREDYSRSTLDCEEYTVVSDNGTLTFSVRMYLKGEFIHPLFEPKDKQLSFILNTLRKG